MIIVDDRETEIIGFMKANGIPYEIKRMDEGDFTNQNEDFLLERKAGMDYAQSIINGHLQVQLARMREQHPNTPLFLIYEGDFDAICDNQTNHGLRMFLRTFPIRLAHVWGVQFIQTWDKAGTVDELMLLDTYSKGIRDVPIAFESVYMTKNFDERIRTLMTIPQLGQKRAEMLLKTFPSIFNMLDHIDEITKLDGMGNKLVENIRDMFFSKDPIIKKRNQEKPVNRQNNQARKKHYAMMSKRAKGK
jgi:ERCC4-type nuclease